MAHEHQFTVIVMASKDEAFVMQSHMVVGGLVPLVEHPARSLLMLPQYVK